MAFLMSKFLKISGITVAVGAALYAGLGYFGVPYIARTVLERFGSTELGRTVTVQDIRFNPWTWRFELEGLTVKSQEGEGYFLTLDALAVDASSATLSEMAPVIEEVTIQGLKGTLTWSDDNLKEAKKYESTEPQPAEESAGGLPAFAVYNVNVSDTSLHFVDKTRGIDQKIEDFTLALPFVSTLPAQKESLVTPRLSLKLNGTPIVATGSTRPFGQSLEAQLQLEVDKLDIVPILELVPALRNAPAQLRKGLLTSDLTLVFRNPTGGNPAQLLLSGSIGLDDVLVNQTVADKEGLLASAKQITVRAKSIDPIGQQADIVSILVDAPKVNVTKNDGVLAAFASSAQPSGQSPGTAQAATADTNAAPWQWSLESLSVRNGSLSWHDGTVRPTANVTVSNLKADLTGLTSQGGTTPASYSLSARVLDGTANLKGTVGLSPLAVTASLSGDKLNVKQIATYIHDATGLDVAGLANFTVNARHTSDNTTASGNVTLSRLTVKDKLETLLSVQNANVGLGGLDLAKRQVAVDSVLLESVMVNLRNTKNGLNIPGTSSDAKSAQKTAPETTPSTKADEAAPWQWSLGTATLRGGTVNYKDQTTSPQTSLSVTKLNATAKNFSSAAGKEGDLSVSAQIAGGTVSVAGKVGVTPLTAALAIDTKKLQLAPFSPLARKFAGYGAKSGTVNIDGDLGLKTPKDTTVVQWKGDASLTKFDLVDASNKTLVTLNSVSLDDMDIDTTEPLRASVKKFTMQMPGTKETKKVERVAKAASIIGALTGKKSLQKQADKVTKVLDADITLENVKYANGRISVDGIDRDTIAQGVVNAVNDALADHERKAEATDAKTTSTTSAKK